MLFDEIKVDTVIDNDVLYVSVPQLAIHLAQAVEEFAQGSAELAQIFPLGAAERAFIMGITEGMQNIVIMLEQANDEHSIGSIDTVDELLEKFRDASL